MTELPQVHSCISTDSDQLQQVFSNQEVSKGEPNAHIYGCKGCYSHNMSSSPSSDPPKESGTLFLILISLAATSSRQTCLCNPPRTRRAGWVSDEVTPNLRTADVLDANKHPPDPALVLAVGTAGLPTHQMLPTFSLLSPTACASHS